MLREKLLEKYFKESSDSAADFFNAFIYEGKSVISPDDLEPIDTVEHFTYADVVNYCLKEKKIYSIIIINNDIDNDELMKSLYARVANHNGAYYGEQVSRFISKTFPVITFVVYFGIKEWNPETDFYKKYGISKEEAKFIDEIKLNFVPMAFLTDDQIAKLHGDFKQIALSLRGIRENKMYVPNPSELNHSDRFAYLMKHLSDDVNYEQRLKKMSKDKKEDKETVENAEMMLEELHEEQEFEEGEMTNMKWEIDNFIDGQIKDGIEERIEKEKKEAICRMVASMHVNGSSSMQIKIALMSIFQLYNAEADNYIKALK